MPQLSFPERTEVAGLLDSTRSTVAAQQVTDVRAAAGESKATTERFLELRVLEGEEGIDGTGPGYRLRPEVLQDLPALFRTLPDNHYALYVVNLETNTRRLVIEVFVRNGKLIDPGDDSEGTRDRPPTEKQSEQPQSPQSETQQSDVQESETPPPDVPLLQAPLAPEEAAPAVDFGAAARSWRLGRWSAVALGLAASPASRQWAQQIDKALAQATAAQWRKLQMHNPKERKKP